MEFLLIPFVYLTTDMSRFTIGFLVGVWVANKYNLKPYVEIVENTGLAKLHELNTAIEKYKKADPSDTSSFWDRFKKD